ncbi:MAG: CopG family transcriptional regulator [Candidatus Marsarchaeota archaeon]|jgi:metal-responsive CopG/Arc/MetJ family transcriptional regulator|nr:CopG family transcriptional regulator [Candidatus Marsarchaeota archaeon]MCL5115216.1 CopG family transcriptional regulator [Candidatus Marsarchaeota archaeon]
MRVKRDNRVTFTSVSIPTALFKKTEKHIENTGFPSVSSYVAFLLRMILSDKKSADKSNYETEMIKKRLRDLGYL